MGSQPVPGGGNAVEKVSPIAKESPNIPPRSSSRLAPGMVNGPNIGPDSSPLPEVAGQAQPGHNESAVAPRPELSPSAPCPISVTIERGSICWDDMLQSQGSARPQSQVFSMAPSSSPTAATTLPTISRPSSIASTCQTNATSLAPLQVRGPDIKPLREEEVEPGSFDLINPAASDDSGRYCMEKRSEQLFSGRHLAFMLADQNLMIRFNDFVQTYRPASAPLLVYYFDILKALRAVEYSNTIASNLPSLGDHDFAKDKAPSTVNLLLQKKADLAFDALVREELPAFITHTWIRTATISIKKRITGSLPAHLREMSEGLAEVFCLTDPSREDNPIVFASEEFYRTTQYGTNYVVGRNCRFLQGPKTDRSSIQRLRRNLSVGKEHCETILNYRRDGSPFMNLLMCAPLVDSQGVMRYMLGAQIDVSGLVKDCVGLESLRRLVNSETTSNQVAEDFTGNENGVQTKNDAFREMSELFDVAEMETVRRHGGEMHRFREGIQHDGAISNWQKPRLVIQEETSNTPDPQAAIDLANGRLAGIYEHYLLVRPFPNLRILFTSPSLRVPGILQSPLFSRIGGSDHVRGELTRAFADGTVVTAKVRWINRFDGDGRTRWLHCTPLLGNDGTIGVWMVVIVDDEEDIRTRPKRRAPAVDADIRPKSNSTYLTRKPTLDDLMSLSDLAHSDTTPADPAGIQNPDQT